MIKKPISNSLLDSSKEEDYPMSLNPWLALIIGFLLGWLLEWLLELWFFRRRRLECQRRLSQVEADLQTRERGIA